MNASIPVPVRTDPGTNAGWLQRRRDATPRGIGVVADFFVDRARNAELWDIEGRRFIDFAGGIAVLNTGHVHAKVQAAIAAQLQRFTHSCYQVAPYAGYVSLAERLNAVVPVAGPAKTAFFSTGAEAVENAIKIARVATGRSSVVAFAGGFHGRSLLALSLTGKVRPYKEGFGPFSPEVFHVPYPGRSDSFREMRESLDRLFACDIEPSRVAAVVFEPVQGEGGFHVMRPEAASWLRTLCDRHGILLVADEVQTGFARTGRLFALDHFGVRADLVAMAKSLAGGMTLSAVSGSAAIMDAPAPGGLGGTYAGNPLAVAAAHAVLDVIEEERLCERARALGEELADRLRSLATRCRAMGEIRALGAMVAVDLVEPADGAPSAERAKRVQHLAMQRGLLLLTCGSDGNTLRFLFPLTIEREVFDEGLVVLEQTLEQVAGG